MGIKLTEEEDSLVLYFFTTVFIVIFLVSFFSNIVLITILIRFKHLRTTANLFVLNLAICDLVTVVSGIPATIIYDHYEEFKFGYVGCKTLMPVATVAVNAASTTLLFIAIDRYYVINFPLKARKQSCKVKSLILCFIYGFAIVSAIPTALTKTLIVKAGKYSCKEAWPEGGPHEAVYTVYLTCVQYLVPLPIIAVLYCISWNQIRKQNKIIIKMQEVQQRGKSHFSRSQSWDVAMKSSESAPTGFEIAIAEKGDENIMMKSASSYSFKSNLEAVEEDSTAAPSKLANLEEIETNREKTRKSKLCCKEKPQSKQGMIPKSASSESYVRFCRDNAELNSLLEVAEISADNHEKNQDESEARIADKNMEGRGFFGVLRGIVHMPFFWRRESRAANSSKNDNKDTLGLVNQNAMTSQPRKSVCLLNSRWNCTHLSQDSSSISIESHFSQEMQQMSPDYAQSSNYTNARADALANKKTTVQSASADALPGESSCKETKTIVSSASSPAFVSNKLEIKIGVTKKSPTVSQHRFKRLGELATHAKRRFSQAFASSNNCENMSTVSIKRLRQTRRTLKMFTCVVIVFAVCMVPNQITWLYKAFNAVHLHYIWYTIFYQFTYTNSVLNPWIYGAVNPAFRKAYRKLFRRKETASSPIHRSEKRNSSKTSTLMTSRRNSDHPTLNTSSRSNSNNSHGNGSEKKTVESCRASFNI